MSSSNAIVTTNNKNKNGAPVTMNGNRLNKNNNTKKNAGAAINFSKNGAPVTMNGNRLNKNNNTKKNAGAAINFSKNGAPVTMNGNRLNKNNKGNKVGSFGPTVNAKTNNKTNPFGLVFASNGAPKVINNPLFQANVKKYRPINNLFTTAGKNTSGITRNMKNNRPFGYVIPVSAVKNNPNMQVLLKNAGYKEKNNHFVHPLVSASPNGLFVNNAPAAAKNNAPAVAKNNAKNNKLNAECLKLKGEYKSLLQRMKDSKCNMNGIAQ